MCFFSPINGCNIENKWTDTLVKWLQLLFEEVYCSVRCAISCQVDINFLSIIILLNTNTKTTSVSNYYQQNRFHHKRVQLKQQWKLTDEIQPFLSLPLLGFYSVQSQLKPEEIKIRSTLYGTKLVKAFLINETSYPLGVLKSATLG